MKRSFICILALALVAFFVAPSFAAEWNLYGSARVKTFWEDTELAAGTVNNAGDDDDFDLNDWGLQSNSRLGARVKGEAVTGRVEFGFNPDAGSLWTRLIYGQWDFGAAKLLVGQDYTPIAMFYSGQIKDEGQGLLGYGAAYGSRRGQLKLMFGDFQVALIKPETGSTVLPASDTDVVVPKVEAAYSLATDMFNIKVAGGYQTYNQDDGTNDIDINSYIVTAAAGFTPGMFYVKGGGYWGKNMGEAGWSGSTISAGLSGNDINDVDTWGAFGVIGAKPTDAITIEAGYGYSQSELDVAAAGQDEDGRQSYYVQAVFVLAPGMYIIPEVGVFDQMDDVNGADQGKRTYYGAKWQIDF